MHAQCCTRVRAHTHTHTLLIQNHTITRLLSTYHREVLASPLLLNTPSRVDWKACVVSKEEETAMAKALRVAYQPYDFTIEEEED